MRRGRTLWEMLRDRIKGPVELRYHNPLRAKVGSSVTIDREGLKDLNFFVKELHEYRRWLAAREFVFTDYVLLARPLGEADVWVRIRLVPVEGHDADRVAGLSHHVLLLRLDDEFGYDEAFHKVVTDTTGKFEIREGEKVMEEFWRINDARAPYEATVALIRDTDQDGQVDSDEVATVRLNYWDYWREVKDEAGQQLREYLFVEMDRDNGWFQLWRGTEADPQQILVI
jgi:hypothetical protein